MGAGTAAADAREVLERRLRRWTGDQLTFAATCAGSMLFSAVVIWRQRFLLQGRVAFVLMDDAMISMTYARNLADGNGLVWNAGGPRVEGITNPLWAGWMAFLHLLPVDDFKQSLLVMLSNVVLLVLLLWVVRRLALRVAPDDPVVATYAVVLTATFYPLIFWSLGGMEVALVAVLFGFALLSVRRLVDEPEGWSHRDLAGFGLVALAATATRVDTVVGLVAIAAVATLSVGPIQRRRVGILLGAPVLGALAAVTAVRLAYYGHAFPNTYYLKATGVALDVRLAAGTRHMLVSLWAHLAAFGLVVVAGTWGNRAVWVRLFASLVVAQLAYSVWVGGDAWESLLVANRYLSVAIAPAAVLAATGIRRLSLAPRRLAVLCAVLAATLAFGTVTARSDFAVSVDELTLGRTTLAIEAREHWLAYLAAVLGLLVAAYVLTRPTPSVRRSPALIGAGVVVVVVALTNLRATTVWLHHSQLSLGEERFDAAEGLAVRTATAPDASIGVWLAGAEPYFARRPAVDFLGKSDEHIARLALPDAHSFRAGHDKYDLRWSLEWWNPDIVVLGYWNLDGAMHELLDELGYHHLAQGIWARDGTEAVDEPLLRRLLDELAAERVA